MSTLIQALANGVLVAGVYGLVAIGLSLTLGILDSVNFAHSQLLVIGAFGTYSLVTAGAPFYVALIIAVLVTAVVAGLMELGVFRWISNDHMRAIAASLGMILIIQSLAEVFYTSAPRTVPTPWPGSWAIGDLVIGHQKVVVFLIAFALLGAFFAFTRWTRSGLALRAMADSTRGSALMGVKTKRVGLSVFVVGGAMAGAGGALLLSLFPITPAVGDAPMMKGFIIAILGGLGSAPGVMIGALILGVTETLGATYISPIFRDGYGLIVLAIVLLIRPNGIFGLTREERL